jgi:hypothetical protein
MRLILLLQALILGSAACSVKPAPAQTPELTSLPTGRDCARATPRCGDGRCVVEVDNDCSSPITCQLRIESLCQNANGDTGPANASTKQVTQLARSKKYLETETSCGQGNPVTTNVESFTCI